MVESEKVIERNLVRAVKEAGGMCIKLLCDQLSGLPDRLCLFPDGSAVFVELKTTGKKPRKLQLLMHKRLRLLGFRVEVIDRTEQIRELINEYVEQREST